MEVLTIRTEGSRCDPPRNVRRLRLEVLTNSSNGATIEGRWVRGWTKTTEGMKPPEPWQIDVYEDRLPAVLERTRTEEHRRKHKLAEELSEHARQDWINEHRAEVEGKPEAKRAEFVDRMGINLQPEHHYRLVGLPSGLPPLEYCKVVHPTTGEAMDGFEFAKLDRAKRDAWMMAAPRTVENATELAADKQANVIADAIARVLDRSKK